MSPKASPQNVSEWISHLLNKFGAGAVFLIVAAWFAYERHTFHTEMMGTLKENNALLKSTGIQVELNKTNIEHNEKTIQDNRTSIKLLENLLLQEAAKKDRTTK